MCDMFIPTMLISTIWGGLLPCHYYVAIIVTVIIIISTITIGRQLFRDATLDVDSVELEFFFFSMKLNYTLSHTPVFFINTCSLGEKEENF